MNTLGNDEVFGNRLAQMTYAERAEYEAAYEDAGSARGRAEYLYAAQTGGWLASDRTRSTHGTTQPTIAKIEPSWTGWRLPI